jgi:hypothetical protein
MELGVVSPVGMNVIGGEGGTLKSAVGKPCEYVTFRLVRLSTLPHTTIEFTQQ